MYTIAFILLLIYIVSIFLFDRLRMMLIIMTMAQGLVFLLNDFYPTMIPESTLKLTFILTFLLYCMMNISNVLEAKQ
jgi:hypothetical protein